MDKQNTLASQYATFLVAGRLYGLDVQQVQEVTKSLPLSPVPHAPSHVQGLINLRGQVATAIGLRELLQVREPSPETTMTVICSGNGLLLSLTVDEIGEVIEVESKDFERPPDTVPESARRFISGVFKLKEQILTILDLNKITQALNSGMPL